MTTSAALSIEDFDALRAMIHAHSGIWLGDDKLTFLQIRLADCLRRVPFSSPREYYHFLKYDPCGFEEMNRLVDAVTVNETWFFRETEPILAWRKSILPNLVLRDQPVRIWSAGCSTGEEPHSLGMLMLDAYPVAPEGRFNIIATDISERVLQKARAGIYDQHSLRHTEERWLNCHFESSSDGLRRVSSRVRNMIEWRQANLMDANLGARLAPVDLILCRNVLIYFNEHGRNAAIANFYSALKPGGFLILSLVETLAHTFSPFETARLDGAILYRKPSVN